MDTNNLPNNNIDISKRTGEKVEDYFSRLVQQDYTLKTTYQDVVIDNVTLTLEKFDRSTADMRDAIWCLLNNEFPSIFPTATDKTIADGASVAHIGSYVGILMRHNKKLDREGRDYWIKPLIDIAAIEPVTLVDGEFQEGHLKAKSPNSAYRLSPNFVELMQSANASDFDERVTRYAEAVNERLAVFSRLSQNNINAQGISAHKQLILDSINVYAAQFLPGYIPVFTDCEDGDRVTDEEHAALDSAGIVFGQLTDVWPDAILYNESENSLCFIEAVTSDGEVDNHKYVGLSRICENSGKIFAGCTTTYETWKKLASRQQSENNLSVNSYISFNVCYCLCPHCIDLSLSQIFWHLTQFLSLNNQKAMFSNPCLILLGILSVTAKRFIIKKNEIRIFFSKRFSSTISIYWKFFSPKLRRIS